MSSVFTSLQIRKSDLARYSLSRGAFETLNGLGEFVRGRTLAAIDKLTGSGNDESRSRHTSLLDRSRTQVETGMAHMYGYADPEVYRDELRRLSNPATGAPGNGHTTETGPGRGSAREGEGVYDEHGGRPGGQDFEQQQSADNRNTQIGPPDDRRGGSPQNRTPQNAGSEVGWTSISQAASLTPTQLRTKRDFLPEVPPRSQGQSAGDDQHEQMHQ